MPLAQMHVNTASNDLMQKDDGQCDHTFSDAEAATAGDVQLAAAILDKIGMPAIEAELQVRSNEAMPDEDLCAFWEVLSATTFRVAADDPGGAAVKRIVHVGCTAVAAAAAGELGRTKTEVCVEKLKKMLCRLPGWALVRLVAAVTATLPAGSEGKQLDLLPHLLEAAGRLDSFPRASDGSGLPVAGDDFRDEALRSLLDTKWAPAMCAHLASTLRDISGLSLDLLKQFVTKFVDGFSELEIEGLPPVVYQLLVLCTKTDRSVGKLLLTSVVGYFRRLDERSAALDESDTLSQQDSIREPILDTRQLRSVEGTVILQINFAVKHDQPMGKECISLLKADAAARTPFGLALLFSLARISWLEDP